MFTKSHGWLWQFESDLKVHGMRFAAERARDKGVPLAMCLSAAKIIQAGR